MGAAASPLQPQGSLGQPSQGLQVLEVLGVQGDDLSLMAVVSATGPLWLQGRTGWLEIWKVKVAEPPLSATACL